MASKIKWDLVIFTVLVLALLLTVKSDLDQNAFQQNEEKKLSGGIRQEKERQKALLKKLDDLGGSAGAELIARERLGLVKSGETAYKVIESK